MVRRCGINDDGLHSIHIRTQTGHVGAFAGGGAGPQGGAGEEGPRLCHRHWCVHLAWLGLKWVGLTTRRVGIYTHFNALGRTQSHTPNAVAGVMGAKRTSELVPFCHPLSLDNCQVRITSYRARSQPTHTKHTTYHAHTRVSNYTTTTGGAALRRAGAAQRGGGGLHRPRAGAHGRGDGGAHALRVI